MVRCIDVVQIEIVEHCTPIGGEAIEVVYRFSSLLEKEVENEEKTT